MDQFRTFAQGKLLGDFAVEKLIGGNQFSAVYLARHQLLGHLHALRLIPQPLLEANPPWREQLHRSIAAAATVHHPNIVEFSGVFQCREEQLLAIDMEYMPEGNLLDYLMHHPEANTLTFLLKLTGKIASALAETAKHGAVHGNITPGNLLIDAQGEVKLADLGIIPPVRDRLSRYMAPEELNNQADIRSDIYSLGMCLYHFAAGQMPYHSHEFFDRVAAEGLPEPRTLCPAMLPELNRFIVHLTQQSPQRRPQTPEELLEEAAALRSQLNRVAAPAAPKIPPPAEDMTPAATIQLGQAPLAGRGTSGRTVPSAIAAKTVRTPKPPPGPPVKKASPPPPGRSASAAMVPEAEEEAVVDELELAKCELPSFRWQQLPLLIPAYLRHVTASLKNSGAVLRILIAVIVLNGLLSYALDWVHQEAETQEMRAQRSIMAFRELQELATPARRDQLRGILAAEGDWESLVAMSEKDQAADGVANLSSQTDPDALVTAATAMMLQLDKPHQEKDFLPLLEKAAESGSPEACAFLSSWYEAAGDDKKAKRYRTRRNEQVKQIIESRKKD